MCTTQITTRQQPSAKSVCVNEGLEKEVGGNLQFVFDICPLLNVKHIFPWMVNNAMQLLITTVQSMRTVYPTDPSPIGM